MANITFYGTRGGHSLTSEKYMEFGGATTCIGIEYEKTMIMIDCGTGITNALDDLESVDVLHLFITHSHFDHINGIVSLLPAYKGKKLHIYSKTFNQTSIKDSISRIMSQSLWPVRAEDYSRVEFHEIDGDVLIDDILVRNMDSNHPGGCSLYRFIGEGDDIVTAFDFSHLNGYEDKLLSFAKGCKVLIYDGNFSEEEMEEKGDMGHSSPEAGARIGEKLKVDHLYITHFGFFDDETLGDWEERLQKQYPFISFARSGIHRSEFLKMIDIGSMLHREKNTDQLLIKIVEAAMEITNADGGTLYLFKDERLDFKVLINKSMGINRLLVEGEYPSVKLWDKNICAASAREKRLINIKDCYSDENYDFSGTRKFDEMNRYQTKSVMVVPLIDDHDDLIGILQLINAKNKSGQIIAFEKREESVVQSLANQAALTIIKSSYSDRIDDLLYGFVKVMSVSIDERTPYNANHTKNMIRFAECFFDYQENHEGKYRVNRLKRREILMAIWLHDVGKLLIPMDIMNKDDRLGELYTVVMNRYERRDLLLRIFLAKGIITEDEYQGLEKERESQLNLVRLLNFIVYLSDDMKDRLEDLRQKTYMELDLSMMPCITDDEYHRLSVRTGTLTDEERNVMKEHVVMTQKLLGQLNFPKGYENIPEYAGNHHEFLDGTGYPNHLKAEELSWPCRLITVFDILEALIAKDRPYKKSLEIEKALSILKSMANEGKLDVDIVEEVEKAQVWL